MDLSSVMSICLHLQVVVITTLWECNLMPEFHTESMIVTWCSMMQLDAPLEHKVHRLCPSSHRFHVKPARRWPSQFQDKHSMNMGYRVQGYTLTRWPTCPCHTGTISSLVPWITNLVVASRHRGIEPSITEYMELINRNICRNIQDPQSANLHSGTKIKTHKTHKTHNPQKLRHPMTLLWLWEAQRRWARHTGQHTSPHLRRAKREKHTVSICFNPNPVRSVSIAEKIACSHMFSCTYVFYCVVLFFARPHASIQCHTSISLSQRKRHLRGSLTCHIYSIEE